MSSPQGPPLPGGSSPQCAAPAPGARVARRHTNISSLGALLAAPVPARACTSSEANAATPPPRPPIRPAAAHLVRRCVTQVQEAARILVPHAPGAPLFKRAWAQEPHVLNGVTSPYYKPPLRQPPKTPPPPPHSIGRPRDGALEDVVARLQACVHDTTLQPRLDSAGQCPATPAALPPPPPPETGPEHPHDTWLPEHLDAHIQHRAARLRRRAWALLALVLSFAGLCAAAGAIALAGMHAGLHGQWVSRVPSLLAASWLLLEAAFLVHWRNMYLRLETGGSMGMAGPPAKPAVQRQRKPAAAVIGSAAPGPSRPLCKRLLGGTPLGRPWPGLRRAKAVLSSSSGGGGGGGEHGEGGVRVPSVARCSAAWARFLQDDVCMGLDLESFLSAWFRGAPFQDIRRGNVEGLLAYAFYYRTMGQMRRAGLGHVPASMTRAVERKFGVTFPAGMHAGLRFMGHLNEPLRVSFRPLAFYAGTELLARAAALLMRGLGFSSRSLDVLSGPLSPSHGAPSSVRVSFFVCNLAAGPPTQVPIVFLHGVGVGLVMYTELIQLLAASGHPVIVLESPHVAMRHCVSGRIPTTDQVAHWVCLVLRDLRLPRACIVAHSYGTLVASCLYRLRPDLVHSLCLLDPVCLGMFMPHLLRSFVYRMPTCFKEALIWLASRDLATSAFFCRSFFWSDINLWPEMLPAGRTLLVLHGCDRLMDVPAVRRWLAFLPKGSVRVMYEPSFAHGGMLLNPAWQHRIVSGVLDVASG